MMALRDHMGADEPHALATVMLVDDNDAALELTRIVLHQSRLHCRMVSASSGEEALAFLQAEREAGRQVDLLLLDINMPKLDGFEVLSQLYVNGAAGCPAVVMCSSLSTGRDIARASALGAAGCVEKPPRLETLKPLLSKTSKLRFEEDANGVSLLRAA